MENQTSRQRARRAASAVQAQRRTQWAEREKRLEALAIDLLTALGERDAAVIDAERRAGVAVAAMTKVEGLTLRDVVEWCGGQLTPQEATRLRRLAQDG